MAFSFVYDYKIQESTYKDEDGIQLSVPRFAHLIVVLLQCLSD